MSSYHPPLPDHRGLWAARECTRHFAPYGFRATWHHLVTSAHVPGPGSAARAADELDEARRLWHDRLALATARRRLAKTAGRRPVPRTGIDGWIWAPGPVAYCPDFTIHPRERLAVVLSRLITAYDAGGFAGPSCPVCSAPRTSPACPRCGVDPLAETVYEPRGATVRWRIFLTTTWPHRSDPGTPS